MERNPSAGRVPVVDNVISAELDCFDLGGLTAARELESNEVAGSLGFEAFYAEERSRVYSALALTLGNADLAADAADEAMARAFQHWASVQTYANPGGWAFRVGLNWARSILRRRHRSPHLLYQGDSVEAVVTDPDVHRALGQLDVKHRAVVVCRYVFGWSERETAEALELRPGTVKSRLSRATKQLQVQLGHLRQEETR